MTMWTKCPSVTSGGKPWFWHTNQHGGVWVVWNRQQESWVITDHNAIVLPVKSAAAGMSLVNAWPQS